MRTFCALLSIAAMGTSSFCAEKKKQYSGNVATPEARIPVETLGYKAPGLKPAFEFQALISLHYIDASHLLFTFDNKSLLRRDDRCSGTGTQRMVRAVVLDLPSGKVERQADWELYDFSDYLWSLGNGQFLLRSCSRLQIVGATLDPHPLIEPSGSVEAIGFSPDRSVVVVEEASDKSSLPQKQASQAESRPAARVDVEFIRLHPLGVITRAELPVPGVIPIIATGILEALAAPHNRWTINFQPFHGADRKIATLDSKCMPRLKPVSENVAIAITCPTTDQRAFQGFDLNGTSLWQMQLGADRHDPRFLLTQNGAHFAIESLHTKQPLAPLDPLNRKLIDGEVIDIYDTRTGVRIGSLQTTPVYTAGTNADFSPDGRHLAVLHDGAIEIYALSELARNHP